MSLYHSSSKQLGLSRLAVILAGSILATTACTRDRHEEPTPRKAGRAPIPAETPAAPTSGAALDAAKILQQAQSVFGQPLAVKPPDPNDPTYADKIALGRMLYFEKRLSKNHDLSCNSCHSLSDYGIDVRDPEDKRQVSRGHKGQVGDRNAPTVYNAGLHFRQFWDGRAADLMEQAKGPVLNPVEMAMASEDVVVAVLKSIPGYVEAFKRAFPGDADPITYDNMARAIAAFEAGLVTPAPFDKFLEGDNKALTEQQLRGLSTFIEVGCTTCHMGAAVGGSMYQKLGLLKPFETKDFGRFKTTSVESDKFFFKVPSLRNIEKTAPYLHDGSVPTLEQMITVMAEHQVPRGKLDEQEVADIVAFLKSLTGSLPPAEYIAEPELPPSGPKTPKPDPG